MLTSNKQDVLVRIGPEILEVRGCFYVNFYFLQILGSKIFLGAYLYVNFFKKSWKNVTNVSLGRPCV